MAITDPAHRAPPAHCYTLFGMVIASDLALPELRPCPPAQRADVEIRLADRPPRADPSGGAHAFEVPGVASYMVKGGHSVTVIPDPAAHEANIRLFLLGSAMGIILHQRGILALHANAIDLGGRAVAFMGPSGAGKSTLASWFLDQGFRLIADDVCAIRVVGETADVLPGIPRLRLWEEAIKARGGSVDGLALSYAGDPDYRKYDLPLSHGLGTDGPIPLTAAYMLKQGDERRIVRIEGVAAIQTLYANTYRGEYVRTAGRPEAHMAACVGIARIVPCFDAERRWGLEEMDEENRHLLAHARQMIAK